jgi:hypothetical protein
MDQMILSEPSIIIISTYKDMMKWISRILVEEMAGADENLGQNWANVADFLIDKPTSNLIQQNPHGPNDPFRTIKYHHLNISGHDGMDEQDIGWRNGWC